MTLVVQIRGDKVLTWIMEATVHDSDKEHSDNNEVLRTVEEFLQNNWPAVNQFDENGVNKKM